MNKHPYNSYINIKSLSVAERIQIVQDIWDSIVLSIEEFSLSKSQKKELDSRLESYYSKPEEGKSWKEIRDNIKSRL